MTHKLCKNYINVHLTHSTVTQHWYQLLIVNWFPVRFRYCNRYGSGALVSPTHHLALHACLTQQPRNCVWLLCVPGFACCVLSSPVRAAPSSLFLVTGGGGWPVIAEFFDYSSALSSMSIYLSQLCTLAQMCWASHQRHINSPFRGSKSGIICPPHTHQESLYTGTRDVR